jgi:hypothetical protein
MHQMKLLFSALIAAGLSLAALPSLAADSRNVSVINETGYAIKFLGSTDRMTVSTSGITNSKAL